MEIDLSWSASPTAGATYNVYASATSGFTPSALTRVASNVAATSFHQQGLLASTTYYYLVTAVDPAGESAASNSASATTQSGATGGGSCSVSYAVTTQWGNGFTAAISITNQGGAAIHGWSLTWTWPGNQQMTLPAWNANGSQTGANASLTNLSYNAAIAPGATITGIGFNGSYSGQNPMPASFSLNGSVCGGSGGVTPPPAAPSAPAATAASPSQINLSWSASSTAGVTYSVYSSSTSGFTPSTANRVTSGLTATAFQDTGLKASTAYYFVITAVNAAGESAPSAQVSATTQAAPALPAAPANLQATPASSSQINLTWSPSATAGVTYNVYAGSAAGFAPSSLNRVAAGLSTTGFQHAGLSASTTYYYLVTAVNAAGESLPSNQASAKTQAAVTGGAACHITFVDQNDWGIGFTGAISIANTGAGAINGWVLTWTWLGNQQLSGAWNANGTQSGSAVTFGSASWNGSIAPGATLTGIGFNANYSGVNSVPSAFYLNGARCQ
jgi:hypothetical protein